MKQLKKVALISGLALFAWQYPVYRRDKATALQKLRAGSRIADLDTGRVEYATEGEGRPMLCIHGGGGGYEQGLITGRMLNYEGRYQIIAPSRAGARRTPVSSGLDFAHQAKAYCQLLDHLNVDQAIVVGLSAGGLSSLQFALDYPKRCEALILLSAVSPLSAQIHAPEAALLILNAMMASDFLVWALQKISLSALFRINGSRANDFSDDSLIRELVWNFFPSSDWRENVMNDMRQLHAMRDFPFEEVAVPTLLLHGDADPIILLKVAEHTARRLPNAKLVRISKGSHLMLGTDTAVLHEQMNQFLSE